MSNTDKPSDNTPLESYQDLKDYYKETYGEELPVYQSIQDITNALIEDQQDDESTDDEE